MDVEFEQFLRCEGITHDTMQALQTEAIVSKKVFRLLHEEHLQKLLAVGKIKIGQHAILTDIWQKAAAMEEGMCVYSHIKP